jgi:hypothetical protein
MAMSPRSVRTVPGGSGGPSSRAPESPSTRAAPAASAGSDSRQWPAKVNVAIRPVIFPIAPLDIILFKLIAGVG